MILGFSFAVTVFAFFKKFKDFESAKWGLAGIVLVLLIVILFWIVRLRTRIDSTGISARFEPVNFLKRSYKWTEIKDCYVRKYAPVREYGGWGVRGSQNSKAYNVSGNMGIQIITKADKKFLIGTKKPRDAKRTLKYYREKK